MLELLHPATVAGLVAPQQVERLGAELLIVDRAANAVVAFPTGGPPRTLITSKPSESPRFLAVGSEGEIFVSHADGTIRQYDASGALVNGAFATGLSGDVPIAFTGSLVAIEGGTGNLLVYTGPGERLELGAAFRRASASSRQGPTGRSTWPLSKRAASTASRPRSAPFSAIARRPRRGPPRFRPSTSRSPTTPVRPSRARRRRRRSATRRPLRAPESRCSRTWSLDAARELLDPARAAGRAQDRRDRQCARSQSLKTKGANRLLVPSSLNGTGAPAPLGDTEVDVFQCYQARAAAAGGGAGLGEPGRRDQRPLRTELHRARVHRAKAPAPVRARRPERSSRGAAP